MKSKSKSKKVSAPNEVVLEQKYGQGVLFPGRRHGVRGGCRAGAGRHRTNPAGARPRSFRVTDEEAAAIRDFLNDLRNKDDCHGQDL